MSIKQILTFSIADENYGIDVIQVREILSNQKITPVPGAAEYMLGIINVRGCIVPVIDLRKMFLVEPSEQSVDTSIVVLETCHNDEDMTLGVLVDSVQEVRTIIEDQIEDAPKMGMTVSNNLIKGIGKIDDGFVVILDLDTLLEEEILSEIKISATYAT